MSDTGPIQWVMNEDALKADYAEFKRLMDRLGHDPESFTVSERRAYYMLLVGHIHQLEEVLREKDAQMRKDASLYCDKPEDRLYHASDKTWWRREFSDGPMRGQLVSAAPAPSRIEGMLRALITAIEAGEDAKSLKTQAEASKRLLGHMGFAYAAENTAVSESFGETAPQKTLDEIKTGRTPGLPEGITRGELDNIRYDR